MKKTYYLPLILLLLSLANQAQAQRRDNFAKLGPTAFFLSDGRKINHSFLCLGISYEHQFSGQFSTGLNVNAGRLVSGATSGDIDGYIRNVNSLELELRFYPNNKGKGFYAGASAVLYGQKKVTGETIKRSNHFGSHINAGFQFPLHNDFILQTNGQIGIYGKGYSTISRYGLQVMLGKRF